MSDTRIIFRGQVWVTEDIDNESLFLVLQSNITLLKETKKVLVCPVYTIPKHPMDLRIDIDDAKVYVNIMGIRTLDYGRFNIGKDENPYYYVTTVSETMMKDISSYLHMLLNQGEIKDSDFVEYPDDVIAECWINYDRYCEEHCHEDQNSIPDNNVNENPTDDNKEEENPEPEQVPVEDGSQCVIPFFTKTKDTLYSIENHCWSDEEKIILLTQSKLLEYAYISSKELSTLYNLAYNTIINRLAKCKKEFPDFTLDNPKYQNIVLKVIALSDHKGEEFK